MERKKREKEAGRKDKSTNVGIRNTYRSSNKLELELEGLGARTNNNDKSTFLNNVRSAPHHLRKYISK